MATIRVSKNKDFNYIITCHDFVCIASGLSVLQLIHKVGQHMSQCIRKQIIGIYAKSKSQISFTETANLISAFVFATWIVHSLLLLKSEISRFYPASVTVHAGLCQTLSETQIVGFVMQRLTL